MPLYEYKCHKCGKKFDVLQKFSDAPVTVHEECGGDVEKMVSAPAFHFKGTGWYVTDYAKSNGVSTPASESAKAEGKAEGKSEGKSESKSEAKADSKSETKTDSSSTTKTESTPASSTSSTSTPSSDK